MDTTSKYDIPFLEGTDLAAEAIRSGVRKQPLDIIEINMITAHTGRGRAAL